MILGVRRLVRQLWGFTWGLFYRLVNANLKADFCVRQVLLRPVRPRLLSSRWQVTFMTAAIPPRPMSSLATVGYLNCILGLLSRYKASVSPDPPDYLFHEHGKALVRALGLPSHLSLESICSWTEGFRFSQNFRPQSSSPPFRTVFPFTLCCGRLRTIYWRSFLLFLLVLPLSF